MRIVDLLPGVDEGQAALEVVEGRPVAARGLLREDVGRAGAVMVFKEAELDIVVGIEPFLGVQPVGVLREGDGAFEVVPEVGVDVVVIGGVKRLIELGVGQARKALCAGGDMEAALNRFAQPEAAGTDGRDLCAGALPELQRDERRDIAAEAVDEAGPGLERFDLVVPELWVAVVQIRHVPPVAEAVAERAVGLVVEPFGVVFGQPGVGRGVVIDDVDDALHAAGVDGVDQMAEIVERAELGVDSAVVTDGIWAAEAPLAVFLAGGMDGQQPDDIRAEGLDAVKVGLHGGEGALFGVIADVDGIQDLIAQGFFRIDSHKTASFWFHSTSYFTQIMEKGKSAN